MNKTSSSNLFLTLLLVLFIGLKLGHVIEWSWWWVFSPVWIPLAFVALILLLIAFGVWSVNIFK